MCLDSDQELADLKEQLADIKAQIKAVSTSGQEHSLNDGQVDTRVKHVDLGKLFELKSSLENDIAAIEGCGVDASYIY